MGSKRPLEPPLGTRSVSSDATGSLATLPARASSFASAASAGGPLCGPPAVKTRRLDPLRCNPSGPVGELAVQDASPNVQGPGVAVGPIGARGHPEDLRKKERRLLLVCEAQASAR